MSERQKEKGSSRPRRARHKLFDLNLHEVSLVDYGANLKQHLIHKNQEARMSAEVADKVAKQGEEIKNAVAEAIATMMAKRATAQKQAPPVPPPAGPPAASAPAQPATLSPQAQAALSAAARLMLPFKNEITQAEVNAMMAQIGVATAAPEAPAAPHTSPPNAPAPNTPAAAAPPQEKPQIPPPGAPPHPAPPQPTPPKEGPKVDVERPEDVHPAHHAAAEQAAQQAYMNNLEETGYNLNKAQEAGEQEMPEQAPNPAATEPVTKAHEERVAKAEARAEAAEKRAQEQAEILKGLQEERLDRLFKDRARTYKNLTVGEPEMLTLYKNAHAQGEDAVKVLEQVLKAADEQVAQSANRGGGSGALLREQGTSRSDGNVTPNEKLEALIDKAIGDGDTNSRAVIAKKIYATPEGQKLRAQMRQAYEEKVSR